MWKTEPENSLRELRKKNENLSVQDIWEQPTVCTAEVQYFRLLSS